MKNICVIGSLNIDLVATVERFPKPGETITGKDFSTFTGGKGANQAVALGRLGANVEMIGKVGDDFYGRKYLKVLEDNGVKTRGIGIEAGVSTGVALIEVESSGNNRIVVIPGANGKVDIEFINDKMNYILENDIFLFQLEIPLDTVEYCIKKIKETQQTSGREKIVILDPAPAIQIKDELLKCVDYITPNETEIEILTGIKITNQDNIKKAAYILLDRGVKTVIAKAGGKGAYIVERNKFFHAPAPKVNVVDTTAAGDSFNAGFAFSLSQDKELEEAIRFANAVASLSVTAKGAQEAMPTIKQVQDFIKTW
ncbi:MAG TPA: ribokinase [Clostridiaceae bacterium]|nr:ribokinase [Clostridiaceae bacterium]